MRVERHLADCNWGLIAVNGGLPRDRFANRNGHYGHVLHFSKLSPTVERKRKLFEKINDTEKRGEEGQVAATSHHKDRATVHGRVEAQDTKGSTWISKDAR
jgi:hypothetical protein